MSHATEPPNIKVRDHWPLGSTSRRLNPLCKRRGVEVTHTMKPDFTVVETTKTAAATSATRRMRSVKPNCLRDKSSVSSVGSRLRFAAVQAACVNAGTRNNVHRDYRNFYVG